MLTSIHERRLVTVNMPPSGLQALQALLLRLNDVLNSSKPHRGWPRKVTRTVSSVANWEPRDCLRGQLHRKLQLYWRYSMEANSFVLTFQVVLENPLSFRRPVEFGR